MLNKVCYVYYTDNAVYGDPVWGQYGAVGLFPLTTGCTLRTCR